MIYLMYVVIYVFGLTCLCRIFSIAPMNYWHESQKKGKEKEKCIIVQNVRQNKLCRMVRLSAKITNEIPRQFAPEAKNLNNFAKLYFTSPARS